MACAIPSVASGSARFHFWVFSSPAQGIAWTLGHPFFRTNSGSIIWIMTGGNWIAGVRGRLRVSSNNILMTGLAEKSRMFRRSADKGRFFLRLRDFRVLMNGIEALRN
jgi:hypothetical protein